MMTDGLFDALCPAGSLPVGDQREEALASLLEAPRHINDPRMRPYLDASFRRVRRLPTTSARCSTRWQTIGASSWFAGPTRLFRSAWQAGRSSRTPSLATMRLCWRRFPPDDVVRVRMVIEARKGARCRFAWHGRVKEENYAHV